MICLNKILENFPELKIAEKGVKNEETFFYACQLCDGKNNSCSENTENKYPENLRRLFLPIYQD